MKNYTMLLAILFFLSFSIYAQEAETDSKIINKIDGAEKVDSPQATGDKVRIKDGTTTLIEITNEGSAGSIMLPSVGSSLTGPKLYSNGVNLFWGNSQLNGSNGATAINDLSDGKYDGSSLFLGEFAGANNGEDNDNLGLGYGALSLNTSGRSNVAIGNLALVNNLTGDDNTAIGIGALLNSTEGSDNTATGSNALNSNLTGNDNTATGVNALSNNTTGSRNTAIGKSSMNKNTTGNNNTANGYHTLLSNTTGSDNTANGINALFSNKTGNENTANGRSALYSNTTGYENTANGFSALKDNTEGRFNTASGSYTLTNNTNGVGNTAIGTAALQYNTTGDENTAVGNLAGPSSGSVNLRNSTALGFAAKVTESFHVRIGSSLVTSITGQVAFTSPSDGRFKFNVSNEVAGLDFVLGLNPVSYNMDINAMAQKLGEDKRIDENGNRVEEQPDQEIIQAREERTNTRQTGFIAQEVEQLVNNLGVDFDGVDAPKNDAGIYGLRYAEFVVPIVKAMQEQQEMIKDLRAEINELKGR